MACRYPRWDSFEGRLLRTADLAWSRSGRFKLCFGEDFLRWPRFPRFISGASMPQQMNTRRGCIRIVGAGGSLHGKCRADTRSHGIPVARTEMADYAQLRTVSSQHVGAEARLCAESGRSPVLENVISRAWRSRQLRRENPYHCIRTLGEINGACDNHGRPDLGFLGADQNADHHVARLQSTSSDSSASRRRRDAALKSFRSSSDQESDQSIFWFGASSASRSASADSSEAVSGGRRRNAPTSDASRSLSCISISRIQYSGQTTSRELHLAVSSSMLRLARNGVLRR